MGFSYTKNHEQRIGFLIKLAYQGVDFVFL